MAEQLLIIAAGPTGLLSKSFSAVMHPESVSTLNCLDFTPELFALGISSISLSHSLGSIERGWGRSPQFIVGPTFVQQIASKATVRR